MRNTDTLLICYAGTIFSTITILSLLRVTAIEVYVALFVLEFFIVSDLSPGGPVISWRKKIVGIILVAIFVGIMLGRIIEVIMQT